jgi:hypothetical protein
VFILFHKVYEIVFAYIVLNVCVKPLDAYSWVDLHIFLDWLSREWSIYTWVAFLYSVIIIQFRLEIAVV